MADEVNISDPSMFTLNGINGETGEYLVPPCPVSQLPDLIKGRSVGEWLNNLGKAVGIEHFGLPLGVSPENVVEAGWAIVFHQDETEEVKTQLAPLVEHRRRQINKDQIVKELVYCTGDTRAKWLAANGAAAGSVNPKKVPYYVLLVGSPEQIPFEFGFHLDVEYAVGRLYFENPADYGAYVERLIAYETGNRVPNTKEAIFFGTRHPLDRATQLSSDLLVKPLCDGRPAEGEIGVAENWGFQSRKLLAGQATKEALRGVFNPEVGADLPAFLFTATHGVGWPTDHEKQLSTQGALLCQDWKPFSPLAPEHYFAASDFLAGGRCDGMVSFHFACYGGGTPRQDRFFHELEAEPPIIASRAFFAALPHTLLKNGALASIAHVERAWGYSIIPPEAGPQLIPFQNAIGRILLGHPVGQALKDFNERYAVLSTDLATLLERLKNRANISDQDLAAKWIERNDAEGYVVLGDPAAALRVAQLSS